MIVIFSPLPFASTPPLWRLFWSLFVVLLSFKILYHKTQAIKLSPLLASALFFMVGLIFWGGVQISFPIDSSASVFDNIENSEILSVNHQSTFSFLIQFCSHLLLFTVSYHFFLNTPTFSKFLSVCSITVSIYSLYALVVYFMGNDTILWYDRWFGKAALTGTFVNPNNFAAYLGLGAQCLLICLVERIFKHQNHTVTPGRRSFTFNLLLLSFIGILASLMLTGSRAGIVSAFIGMGVLSISIMSMLKLRLGSGAKWKFLLMLLVVLLGMLALPGNVVSANWFEALLSDQRFFLYKRTIYAIMDRPLTGFGMGTFEDVISLYRDVSITQNFRRGHNEFLEMLLTMGLIGLALSLGAVVCCTVFFIRERCNSTLYGALGFSSATQLLTHSVVDFPLQIPAVSLLWSIILGGSVAAIMRAKRNRRDCGYA